MSQKDKKILLTGIFGSEPQQEYDDCAICQLLKKCRQEDREPTDAELQQAFKKVKEGGAVVGGEWLEEN